MYKSLEEICEMTTKEGKPFWKIVQEDDCREQGISEGEAFEQMRRFFLCLKLKTAGTFVPAVYLYSSVSGSIIYQRKELLTSLSGHTHP